ncbi:DoxX family protein [Aliterella atlantica]|uniref:DoxX family protein n=1 Tax=Aliterella atlantica CENA595 TaxID=1618023 RepID=A0A0D8ZUY7_9CYAN|nr:DoxX family protein [Aliterella atlantica]KJH71061.1 DoxX family protein [Aliterella atlantica CENA595]
MNQFLEKYSPYIYAILRIISGLMFAMHGSQKVFGIPGGKSPVPLASLLGVGGILELVCGLLIALGFLASYAAFVASGEMAVAYFMMHASHGFLPIVNQGELAVLYCFLFLYIAARGAGVWSITSIFGRSRAMSAALE